METTIKKDEIKNILKELILDEDIKLLVFEGIEQIFLSKYNLNNIPVDKTENIEKKAINKMQKIIDNKTDKINNQIIKIEKQLKENINYINSINTNLKNNYIILQIKVDKNNINEDIRLLNQVKTYKYNYNFERDDIEVFIDENIVPLYYKNINGDFKYDEKS